MYRLTDDEIIQYGKLISILSKRMISNAEIAEEAAQEVWIEVLKSLVSFKGESKLSTWIYTIAKRVIMRYIRDERIYSTEFLQEYIIGDDRDFPKNVDINRDMWIKSECDSCLTGLFHCLTNESRLIYLFRDVMQLPFSEIAVIMDMDDAAVRKSLSRSRTKLRNFLNRNCRIYNPNSECRCRMNQLLEDINLPSEYQRIRDMSKCISIFHQAEEVLPTKNYWEQFIR